MTPTAAVRSILGDPSGTLSEARCREVVVAVLRAVREPSRAMLDAFYTGDIDNDFPSGAAVREAMRRAIDALIEEVTADD